MNLFVNQISQKIDFKKSIYGGDVFLETRLSAAQDLCMYAQESITQAFDNEPNHKKLHTMMPVEVFVEKVTCLKKEFTNNIRSKEIIRKFIEEIGLSPSDFLFDVPRIRVVPNYDYLNAGVSYAYKPHRDTWYGGVDCQINTWMPVYTIQPEQTMMINPYYFNRQIKNTSANWSLLEWIEKQRSNAKYNIKEEIRIHPVPTEEVDSANELRVAGNTGDMLIFSGSHLHGTVPNYTQETRFSIDFRIMHLNDLRNKLGARNMDSACPDVGAGFKDYFHAHDFSNFQGTD